MSSRPHPISSFTKSEVDKIYRETGSRIRTEWFDIILAPRTQEFARILVVTPRKIGNAPKRNKLRRRFKSIFFEEKFFNSHYDYVIVAKQGSVNLSFQQIKDILVSVYKNNENLR